MDVAGKPALRLRLFKAANPCLYAKIRGGLDFSPSTFGFAFGSFAQHPSITKRRDLSRAQQSSQYKEVKKPNQGSACEK